MCGYVSLSLHSTPS